VHTRLKWRALWPLLRRFPTSGLRLLDAGCGDGSWSLELASRRPEWQIVGVDRSAHSIESACRSRDALDLANVDFVVEDFLRFQPGEKFDLVLSLASAHYLVEAGQGETLFRAFASWLSPDGRLLLFGPRRAAEVPALRFLPPPFELRELYSGDELRRLCETSGLRVVSLAPAVGRLGTVAKQLNRAAVAARPLAWFSYPLQLCLARLDANAPAASIAHASSTWVLVAEGDRAGR
jgi:SAM-dependent methyltransferase